MKVLIIEDEQLAADKLEKMLLKADPRTEILAKTRSVSKTLQWLKEHETPDLIISDIQLLDGSSFEIFRQFTYRNPVIFTTAYDQFAIDAFRLNSVDYLLKPVSQEALEAALEKLNWRKDTTGGELQLETLRELISDISRETTYKKRFMIRTGQKIAAIPVEEILFFYSRNKLTYLVNRQGMKYALDQTLEAVAPLLDPDKFFRANRQYLCRFEAIKEIHPHFKGRVKVILNHKEPHEFTVSSDKTPEFKRWLDQ